jgi:hypothetical protein
MACEAKLLGKVIKVAANTQALLHVLEIGALEDVIHGLPKPDGGIFTAEEVAASGEAAEAAVRRLMKALRRRDDLTKIVIYETVLMSARDFVLFHAE